MSARARRDRRDLILIGLLFFLAVAGCRKKIGKEMARVEEILSALVTASSGLETLIDFMGLEAVGKGYAAKPGFEALLSIDRGYIVSPGFTAVETIDRGYVISPDFTAVETIDRGYIVSPNFIALETLDRGYMVSPAFTALEAIDRGYIVSPGFTAVETIDRGYIVSPGFMVVNAIDMGFIASPAYTALETVEGGFSISAAYIAVNEVSRGLYTCYKAYRPETLECTYRCYVYNSSTNSYIETDCAILGISLPPCSPETCDCCLRNACFEESNRYKSCTETYDYTTMRVEVICNARCIPGCRLTC